MPDQVRIDVLLNASGEPELRKLADALRVVQQRNAALETQLQQITQVAQRSGQAIDALQKIVEKLGKTSSPLNGSGAAAVKEVEQLKTAANDLGGIVNKLNGQRVKITVDDSEVSAASTRSLKFLRDIEAAKQKASRKASPEIQGQQAFVEQLRARVGSEVGPPGRAPNARELEAAEKVKQQLQDEERTLEALTAKNNLDTLSGPLRKLDTSALDAQKQKLREELALETGGEEALLKLRVQDLETVRQIGLAEAKTAEAEQRVNQAVDAEIQKQRDLSGLKQRVALEKESAELEEKVAKLVDKTNQSTLSGVQRVEYERGKALKQVDDLERRGGSVGAGVRPQINAAFDKQREEEEQLNFRGRRGLGGNALQSALYASYSPQYAAFSAVSGLAEKLPAAGIAAGVAAIGVAALGKALFGVVDSAASAAKETELFAARTGLTIREAQDFGAAAKITGVDVNSLALAMRTLAPALTDSSTEGKKAREAIAGMKAEIVDMNGQLKPEGAILQEIATKLAAIPVFADRQTAAQDILGRSARQLAPELLRLADDIQKVHGLDVISEKQNEELARTKEKINELGLVWDRLKQTFAAHVIGQIEIIAPNLLNPGSTDLQREIQKRLGSVAGTQTSGVQGLRPIVSVGRFGERSETNNFPEQQQRQRDAGLLTAAKQALQEQDKLRQPFEDLQKQRDDLDRLLTTPLDQGQRQTVSRGRDALNAQLDAKRGEYERAKQQADAIRGIIKDTTEKLTPQAGAASTGLAEFERIEKSRSLPILEGVLKEANGTKEGLQKAVSDAEATVTRLTTDVQNAVAAKGIKSDIAAQEASELRAARVTLKQAQDRLKGFEGGPRQQSEFERRTFEAQQQAFRLQNPASRFGELPEVITREQQYEYDVNRADKLSATEKQKLIQFQRQNVYQPELQTAAQDLNVKKSTEQYRLQRIQDQASVDGLERQFRVEERIASLKSSEKEGDPKLIELAYQHQLELAQKIYEIHLKDAAVEKDPVRKREITEQAKADLAKDQDEALIQRQLADLENQKRTRDEALKDAQDLARVKEETDSHLYQFEIEHAARLADVNRDRASPASSIQRAYETEQKLAKLAYDFETRQNAVTYVDAPGKRKIEDERARQRLIEDGQRSEYEREERLAQLRKQEREAAKAAAASLYDAIRGGPNGIRDFFKNQADVIGRNAFAAFLGPTFQNVSKSIDPKGQGLVHDLIQGTFFGGSTGAPTVRPEEGGPIAAIPAGQEQPQHSGFVSFLKSLTTGIPQDRTAPLLVPSAEVQAGIAGHPEEILRQAAQTINDRDIEASIKQLAEPGTTKLASGPSEISSLIPHLDPVKVSLDALRGSVDNLASVIGGGQTAAAVPAGRIGPEESAEVPTALTELGAHSLVHSSKNAVTAVQKLANTPSASVTANVDIDALTDALAQPRPPINTGVSPHGFTVAGEVAALDPTAALGLLSKAAENQKQPTPREGLGPSFPAPSLGLNIKGQLPEAKPDARSISRNAIEGLFGTDDVTSGLPLIPRYLRDIPKEEVGKAREEFGKGNNALGYGHLIGAIPGAGLFADILQGNVDLFQRSVKEFKTAPEGKTPLDRFSNYTNAIGDAILSPVPLIGPNSVAISDDLISGNANRIAKGVGEYGGYELSKALPFLGVAGFTKASGVHPAVSAIVEAASKAATGSATKGPLGSILQDETGSFGAGSGLKRTLLDETGSIGSGAGRRLSPQASSAKVLSLSKQSGLTSSDIRSLTHDELIAALDNPADKARILGLSSESYQVFNAQDAKRVLSELLPETLPGGKLEEFHPGDVRVFRGADTPEASRASKGDGAGSYSKDRSIAKAHGYFVSDQRIDRSVPAFDFSRITGDKFGETFAKFPQEVIRAAAKNTAQRGLSRRIADAVLDETGSIGPGSGRQSAQGTTEHSLFPFITPSELFKTEGTAYPTHLPFPVEDEGIASQTASASMFPEPLSAAHSRLIDRNIGAAPANSGFGQLRANLGKLSSGFPPLSPPPPPKPRLDLASPAALDQIIDDRGFLAEPLARSPWSGKNWLTEKPASAFQFYSPNEAENLNFGQAQKALGSQPQLDLFAASEKIDKMLSLEAKQVSAIGDWADGAENSIFNRITGSPSYDAVRYSAAVKGDLGHQKQVIPFSVNPSGADSLYRFTVPGSDAQALRGSLDEHGLGFRTLVPQAGATHVVIYDPGTQLRENVNAFANQHDIDFEQSRGQGEFLGGNTREAGHAVFERVIDDYEAARPGLRRDREAEGLGLPTNRPGRTGEQALAFEQLKRELAKLPARATGADYSQFQDPTNIASLLAAYLPELPLASLTTESAQAQNTRPFLDLAKAPGFGPHADSVTKALERNSEATTALTDAMRDVTPGGGVGPNPLAQNPLPAAAISSNTLISESAGQIPPFVNLPSAPVPASVQPGSAPGSERVTPGSAIRTAAPYLAPFAQQLGARSAPVGSALAGINTASGIFRQIQAFHALVKQRDAAQRAGRFQRFAEQTLRTPPSQLAPDIGITPGDLIAENAGQIPPFVDLPSAPPFGDLSASLSPSGFQTLGEVASIGALSGLFAPRNGTVDTTVLPDAVTNLPTPPAFDDASGLAGTRYSGTVYTPSAGIPTFTAEGTAAADISPVPSDLDEQIRNSYLGQPLPESVSNAANPFNTLDSGLGTLTSIFGDLSKGLGEGGLGGGESKSTSSLLSTPISRLFGLGDIPQDKSGSVAQFGDIFATGATAGAGILGAVSGFKKGGAKGDLSGTASILGSAAVLDPEPISKAILGIGAGISAAISALFPDPRAQRQRQLARELENQRVAAEPFNQPGISVEESATGHAVSEDSQGNIRTLNGRPQVSTIQEAIGFDPLHPDWVVTAPVRQVGIGPLAGLTQNVSLPKLPGTQAQAPITLPTSPLASRDVSPIVNSLGPVGRTYQSSTRQDSAKQDGPAQQPAAFNVTFQNEFHNHAMDSQDIIRRGPAIADALEEQLRGTHRIARTLRDTITQT